MKSHVVCPSWKRTGFHAGNPGVSVTGSGAGQDCPGNLTERQIVVSFGRPSKPGDDQLPGRRFHNSRCVSTSEVSFLKDKFPLFDEVTRTGSSLSHHARGDEQQAGHREESRHFSNMHLVSAFGVVSRVPGSK
jgi:hypothetical protein